MLRLQKEEAPLRREDFEERYARWLKPGSLRVFEQLDVNSDQLVDNTEIRKRMPRWLTAAQILKADILGVLLALTAFAQTDVHHRARR